MELYPIALFSWWQKDKKDQLKLWQIFSCHGNQIKCVHSKPRWAQPCSCGREATYDKHAFFQKKMCPVVLSSCSHRYFSTFKLSPSPHSPSPLCTSGYSLCLKQNPLRSSPGRLLKCPHILPPDQKQRKSQVCLEKNPTSSLSYLHTPATSSCGITAITLQHAGWVLIHHSGGW